jgi:hypothetical protein
VRSGMHLPTAIIINGVAFRLCPKTLERLSIGASIKWPNLEGLRSPFKMPGDVPHARVIAGNFFLSSPACARTPRRSRPHKRRCSRRHVASEQPLPEGHELPPDAARKVPNSAIGRPLSAKEAERTLGRMTKRSGLPVTRTINRGPLVGNPEKLARATGWTARTTLGQLARGGHLPRQHHPHRALFPRQSRCCPAVHVRAGEFELSQAGRR